MYNGINYKFTEEEVLAVIQLIEWAREFKNEEANKTIELVATAFNRPFTGMFNDKSNHEPQSQSE